MKRSGLAILGHISNASPSLNPPSGGFSIEDSIFWGKALKKAQRRARNSKHVNAYRTKANTLVCLFSYAQDRSEWLRWNYRTVSQAKAEELERDGQAQRITRMYNGMVQVVGWRMLVPLRAEKPSPTTLTKATIDAVSSFAHGQQINSRPTRREYDHILKFRCWPIIGDEKAVAVRARITESERLFAERLMGQHGPQKQRECERLIA